jgi:predicted amidohydrolase YtcJ
VLGPERAANISPAGWLLREGMKFTSHHDAPVAFPDTMRVLSATVNRTTRSGKVLGPEHRVEPLVALKAMTLWAAYQHFEEGSKGSIEVGKRADFAILSDDPLTIDRARLADVKVMQTIKDGVPIYTRKQPRASNDAATRAAPLACAESARCFERLAQYRMHAPLHSEEMPHRHAGW